MKNKTHAKKYTRYIKLKRLVWVFFSSKKCTKKYQPKKRVLFFLARYLKKNFFIASSYDNPSFFIPAL